MAAPTSRASLPAEEGSERWNSAVVTEPPHSNRSLFALQMEREQEHSELPQPLSLQPKSGSISAPPRETPPAKRVAGCTLPVAIYDVSLKY